MIDGKALIDPKAELSGEVEIGPFSIVGADVQIGSGTIIGPHAVIKGPTSIGRNNRIFQFASVGEDPQDKKYRQEPTRLEMGDDNVIREYCTIHRGTAQDKGITRIGSKNLFMAYTHIAHDCYIGNHVIMANAASLAGHVRLDDYVILGGFSLVHQFCKIGQHGFTSMGSVITRDVPPYVMVAGRPTKPHGINVIGLERNGFKSESIRAIRKAYKTLYKEGLRLEDAIQALANLANQHTDIQCLVEFLKGAERGVLR